MKSDITRITFSKYKHYRKVIMQQGRVQVDADWNEQNDIQDHHERSVLKDIIGSSGTPVDLEYDGIHGGFKIETFPDDDDNTSAWSYKIKKGHYYVDGILCENEKDVPAYRQPDLPLFPFDHPRNFEVIPKEKGKYIVYLDVWHRHITELDDPQIKEPALGGPDTATRSKIVWQVKLLKTDTMHCSESELAGKIRKSSGGLQAFLQDTSRNNYKNKNNGGNIPCCDIADDDTTKYRGPDNRLYRVEIHKGGWIGKKGNNPPTFKWSRDNASFHTNLLDIDNIQHRLLVASRGKDSSDYFKPGQWVEVIDDCYELWGKPGIMVKIEKVLGSDQGYELYYDPDSQIKDDDDSLSNDNFPREFHPKVRRWDSINGVNIIENSSSNYPLEHGIEVRFSCQKEYQKDGCYYRSQDYWLIPAGVLRGGIEWPDDEDNQPKILPPVGIEHYYTPLALLEYSSCIVEKNEKVLEWNELLQYKEDDIYKDNNLLGYLEKYFGLKRNFNLDIKDEKLQVRRTEDSISVIWPDGHVCSLVKRNESSILLTIDEKLIHVFLLNEGRLCRGRVSITKDCRKQFPILTDLISLYYVGGDGQRVSTTTAEYDDNNNDDDGDQPLLALYFPLVVGVARGKNAVQSAKVRFKFTEGKGDGHLSGHPDDLYGTSGSSYSSSNSKIFDAITDSNGLARCFCKLDRRKKHHQIEAQMVDDFDEAISLPVLFNASVDYAVHSEDILVPTTGIAKIVYSSEPDNVEKRSPLLFGPYYHNLKTMMPPAIILGKLFYYPDTRQEQKDYTTMTVHFMEDYIHSIIDRSSDTKRENRRLHFKAKYIDQTSFYISLDRSKIEDIDTTLYLRWWAIPAKKVEDEVQEGKTSSDPPDKSNETK